MMYLAVAFLAGKGGKGDSRVMSMVGKREHELVQMVHR